jgi:hypothetical protein
MFQISAKHWTSFEKSRADFFVVSQAIRIQKEDHSIFDKLFKRNTSTLKEWIERCVTESERQGITIESDVLKWIDCSLILHDESLGDLKRDSFGIPFQNTVSSLDRLLVIHAQLQAKDAVQ